MLASAWQQTSEDAATEAAIEVAVIWVANATDRSVASFMVEEFVEELVEEVVDMNSASNFCTRRGTWMTSKDLRTVSNI